MKDTLKAIRNDVNHKTLKDLNREMTPFDLPALSPVPQVQENINLNWHQFNVDYGRFHARNCFRRLWREGRRPTVLGRR